MQEGWLIDANDHWVWPPRDNSAWVQDPRSLSTVDARCLKDHRCSRNVGICGGTCRTTLEVTSDPEVEEETSMGFNSRTLKSFQIAISSVLLSSGIKNEPGSFFAVQRVPTDISISGGGFISGDLQ